MLSTLAHYAGLPVSEPVDLLYDPLRNLQTKAGRDYVEARIAADDPDLVTFAPVCGPWSSWQHVNMAKNPEMAKEVLSKRQAWKPVIRWMAGIALDRLKRGRQVLIENPKGSELWNLWDMMKLLSSPEAMDSSTLEHFERVNIDLCAYGLQDSRTKMMHKKPTSIATSSRTLKAAFEDHGRCPGDHLHQHLEGGSRCKHAQNWTEDFCEEIIWAHLCDLDNLLVRSAFPAEAILEDNDGDDDDHLTTFDAIHGSEDLAIGLPNGRTLDEQNNVDEETVNPEAEALEAEPLRARRARWRKLPQATRIVIRRLHTMTGHSSPSSMQRLLRTAGGDPQVIRALPDFHCAACAARKKPLSSPATRSPSDYRFNIELAVDCFEIKDSERKRYTVLSVVCMGTLFHVAKIVSPDGGAPSSRACLNAFSEMWLGWAGPPRSIFLDRGAHNRGVFSETMTSMGIDLRYVGTEAPHQLGRGERQGGILKQILHHVIESRQVSGLTSMSLLIPEATFVKNNRIAHGGFTPSQWTLGKLPLEIDSLTTEDATRYLGSHEEALDPETMFGRQLQLRQAAKEAFTQVDGSQRVRAAMLRKSTPQRGPFVAGDLVCFFRKGKGRTASSGGRWIGPARVLGTEGRSMEEFPLLPLWNPSGTPLARRHWPNANWSCDLPVSDEGMSLKTMVTKTILLGMISLETQQPAEDLARHSRFPSSM